jgi:ubiquinone/menaquinone biosynthesis C-methylase UbiE
MKEEMQNNKRIEKEKKYWDKFILGYKSCIEKNWRIYPSLLDKIAGDVDAGNVVLDVATGPGLDALRIAERASKVYAIDISEPMIEEAKKKAEEKEIKNIEFSVEDAYSLPFDKEMFDTVICNNALHNMINPHKALSEIRRVLKPNGQLIATIVGIGESPKFEFALTIYKLVTGFPVFHKLDMDEFANMVNGYGFTVVNKETIKHPEDRMPILYIAAERRE